MAGLVGVCRLDGAAGDGDLQHLGRMVEASLEPAQFATTHRVGPLCAAYLGYRFERERLGEHVDVDHARVDVMFSGYLFNDEEVRDLSAGDRPPSLAAGIRALYLRDPRDFVERLDGRFQLLLYDRAQDRVVLASDRHGLQASYVRQRAETFDFASSLAAHAVSGRPPLTLDRAATALYLMYRHFIGEGTYFEEVSMPPIASVITIERGELRERQYWRYRLAEQTPWRSPDQVAEELGQAFIDAMARVAREPGAMAVPLSGGLDSRAIAAELGRQGRAFSSYTFGRRGCRDVHIARTVAQQLGVAHHVCDLDPDYLLEKSALIARRTDGAYPVDHGHIAALLDALTPNADVVADGLTGEILSSEKVRDTRTRITGDDPERLSALISKVYQTTSDALVRQLMPDTPSRAALASAAGAGFSSDGHRYLASLIDVFCLRERQRRFTLSGPRILGGETRVLCPFWAKRYADAAFSASPRQRAVQRPYIRMHRKLWPELSRVRWNKTGLPPVAPVWAHRAWIPVDSALSWCAEELQSRARLPQLLPCKGYERYNRWFRDHVPLRDFVREVLLDPQTERRGIYDPAGVRKLIEDQESGRARNADTISQLIGTELFFRQIAAPRLPSLTTRRQLIAMRYQKDKRGLKVS